MQATKVTASPNWQNTAPSILVVWLFAVALVCGPAPAIAESTPFKALAGKWSGWGWVNMLNGGRERVRCKVNYRSSKKTRLNQRIRCNSTSYKIEATTSMKRKGKRISGSWKESRTNSSGSLSGRANKTGLSLKLNGNAFRAGMSIKLVGKCKQSVKIDIFGIEIRSVSMQLKRC